MGQFDAAEIQEILSLRNEQRSMDSTGSWQPASKCFNDLSRSAIPLLKIVLQSKDMMHRTPALKSLILTFAGMTMLLKF